MTMQVIQHIELGSAAANITFSSIPNTFTDLVVVVNSRLTQNPGQSFGGSFIYFNGTTANHSMRRLYGTGSGVGSDSATDLVFNSPTAAATSSTFGNTQIYIPNYTSSASKSVSIDSVTENNGTQVLLELTAGLWSNSAAISSIALDPVGTDTFVAGSSATLYGITKGSDGTTTVS